MEKTNTYENLILEVKDGVAFVTINRPEALNSLNDALLSELDDAFARVASDAGTRVAILTGAGKAFVAGADIARMSELDAAGGRAFSIGGQGVMDRIENCGKLVLAAVNGFALGGGCELAMACDIRFASEKAKFGQPEVNLGIIPGFGGTQRLTRLVGKGMAKYLICGAETIDAAEALRIGLVERVFPPDALLAETEKFARLLMTKAPIAVASAKAAINNGANADLRSGVALEAEAFAAVFGSADKTEGMAAFLQKRPAAFENK